METGKNKTNYVVLAAAAFITWGCMTFRYVGNGFSLAAICFGLLAIFLTIKEHYRPRFQLPSDLRNAMIALYGGLCIVGILQGDIIENLLLGSISVFQLFFITSPMWMILYVGRRMDIRKIVSIIIFANMYAFSIYGLGLYFYQDQQRFTSFYGSPPEVGMLLDILIPFSAAIGAYYWADRRWRIATVLLIPLEFLALILTETRGSYLALAAALIIGMFIWLHKNKHSISKTIKHGIYGAMLLAACGAVGGTLYVGSSSAQRMIGGERLLMWESSYYMWKDHPLLGIGLSKWGGYI